ncbi:SDR family oxidoreductase [Pokkaliibacter sp. MBI-7]|uniref:SDR family NAD(P)-dependent oxidoreductase n=1 Tax=Pokkaliibacter sp. MBI-7 TaxID=3040600 RepID=UPI00244776A1|nr:SDR family oxidoreductase [Pokkaliibacter sp. MBI-7]MDH2435529.1 SDR family oxidoreductase [Pokkaliibacter sp. MBI-7]
MSNSTVLITGASTGIGAVYADRFARRGHDLVIVARDQSRLEALAVRLRQQYSINVDVLNADLTKSSDLALVEERLKNDTHIDTLINNAGVAQSGSFVEQTPELIEKLIALNITALARLAAAVSPRFAQQGKGFIVNISSVVGLAPEYKMSVYGASKAFVLFLSQGMHQELSSKGVYIQALLPAGTYTEIWERAGIDISNSSPMMDVNELVDAALVGFDRRELVTIPPLHNDTRWESLDMARKELLSDIKMSEAATRYKAI